MENLTDKKEYIQSVVGTNIRRIRIEKKLSQRDLADLCNFETSNMCRIEQGGSNLTLMNLYKISIALRVDIRELFNGIISGK
ncbi:MAG: helix-turn-helix transcriptional regulator [Rikenellaceae bacterium]